MNWRYSGPIYLIFELHTADASLLHQAFSQILEAIDSYSCLKHLPFHWRFPARALEGTQTGSDSANSLLSDAFSRGTHMPILSGYSGIAHYQLLRNDLHRELSWAFNNPWQKGIRDLFQDCEPMLFPRYPDWLRGSSRQIYQQFPAALFLPQYLGITAGSVCFLLQNGKRIRQLTETRVKLTNQKLMIKGLKAGCRRPGTLLILDALSVISQNVASELASDLVMLLGGKRPAQFSSLVQLIESDRTNGSGPDAVDDFESG